MSSSTGKPPPEKKPRKPKSRLRALLEGKPKEASSSQEVAEDTSKRFQTFFEKA
ncbi:MAG: hypothetical protein ACXVQX_00275 [Actinomycetota bacterium]